MKELIDVAISEVVKTRCFDTFLIDGPICVSVVHLNAEITLDDAMENAEAVKHASEGRVYPMLVDTREIRSIDKDARDFFSMRNRKGGVNAIAILVASPVSVIVGNFFMGLNKPAVPTKLFRDSAKAIKWLKQYN